jgi:hypothetical protein
MNAIQIPTLIYYRIAWSNVISINYYTVSRRHIRREFFPSCIDT